MLTVASEQVSFPISALPVCAMTYTSGYWKGQGVHLIPTQVYGVCLKISIMSRNRFVIRNLKKHKFLNDRGRNEKMEYSTVFRALYTNQADAVYSSTPQ